MFAIQVMQDNNNNNNNNNNNLNLFTHCGLSVSCFSKGRVKLWTTIYDTKLQTDNITIQKKLDKQLYTILVY